MSIPRNEHPRPQFVRNTWASLNGTWGFEMDYSVSGRENKKYESDTFSQSILVPFCPESSLSGIAHTDFIPACWYSRPLDIPADWQNGRLLIHFEAVDYFCEVYLNGKSVATHRGGYTPFTADVTDYLQASGNRLTVYVEDDLRSGLQPSGKQSHQLKSHGCMYTRTTGIWQSVWMEYVPQVSLDHVRYDMDTDNGILHATCALRGYARGASLTAVATLDGCEAGRVTVRAEGTSVRLTLPLSRLALWSPEHPALYQLTLTLTDSTGTDTLNSYFGMRSIRLHEGKILLNGKPLFQRLILDQGFWPDGICTAPSDAALKKDIELSMNLGFNGARMHERVFERRYLYWADVMGYMVWGEYANWGMDLSHPRALEIYQQEWLESVQRDLSSPALVGWCPFNETWDFQGKRRQNDEVLRQIYQITRQIDPSRPVIDTSGNFHVVTDIYDIHDYEQDPAVFADHYAPMAGGGEPYENHGQRQAYGGQPYFVSEYGGIWWNPGDPEGWGYGKRPESVEEFADRYARLAATLLDNPRICALCYTQLTDVEQEVNGLYYYNRSMKFTPEVMAQLRLAMVRPAAIENEDAVPAGVL